MARRMDGLKAFIAAAGGGDPVRAEAATMGATAVLDELSKAIRKKADHLKRELERALEASPQAAGGIARAEALTPRQRSEQARRASQARWKGKEKT